MELFKNQYTTIVKERRALLGQSEEEVAVYIGRVLMEFGQQSKEMTVEQAQG